MIYHNQHCSIGRLAAQLEGEHGIVIAYAHWVMDEEQYQNAIENAFGEEVETFDPCFISQYHP